jgi:tRNA uracil 4-sulfurtransferase
MIIVRYKEIGIKGNNRRDFEKQLQLNIKHALKKNSIPFKEVIRVRGRIIINTEEKVPQLKNIFGISSFSYTKKYYLDLDEIKKGALDHYEKGSFRITCRRGKKIFSSSVELGRDIGAFVVEHTGAEVDLHTADTEIFIELLEDGAYIYTTKIKGPGGLPVGVEPRIVLLLQDQKSVKAGIEVMKRGCRVDIVKEKDINYSELEEYVFGYTIQEFDSIPEDCFALVVSETLDSMREYPYFVLRPLIAE